MSDLGKAIRVLIRAETATALSKFVEATDNAAHNAELAQKAYQLVEDEIARIVQVSNGTGK